MQREQKELQELVHELMWHMRGGLTREEAWTLCPEERTALMENVKKRVEVVEKTGLALL